jgi:hypothetical protein
VPGRIVHFELAADCKDADGNSFSLRLGDPNAA